MVAKYLTFTPDQLGNLYVPEDMVQSVAYMIVNSLSEQGRTDIVVSNLGFEVRISAGSLRTIIVKSKS